ncbi:hypothetical protein N431DRAFT_350644 [Stipitochalara longipes BDJ]|nr:hypothetical protein N431DRAFT_350644 [Stipitochalara longipes BDJ]
MHFQTIAIILATATLTSSIFVPGNIPDGLWHGIEYPNGTTLHISLNKPPLASIIEQHEVVPRSIEERGSGTGGCWGYFLDHASVDEDNQALQAWRESDSTPLCSGGNNEYYGEVVNSVMVYACVDTHNLCWDITVDNIVAGMGLMDAICEPYEAGWALFPRSDSQRLIMGKCVINSSICQ